jgi:hypothetical protein
MKRFAIAFLILAGLGYSRSSSAADLFLQGLPASYVPSSTIEFSAHLLGTQSLATYQIELVLQGKNVVDLFSFDIPDPSSNSNYVFANASDGFQANVSFVAENHDELRLIIADTTSTPVTTALGSDLITNIRLMIAPSFEGSFSIYFDSSQDSLILETINGSSIPNFNQLRVIPSQSSPAIVTIPEPSGLILLLMACAGWMLRNMAFRNNSVTVR